MGAEDVAVVADEAEGTRMAFVVGLDGVKDGAEKDEPSERSGFVPDEVADVSAGAAAERMFSAADIVVLLVALLHA
jgi:hypothetical protein